MDIKLTRKTLIHKTQVGVYGHIAQNEIYLGTMPAFFELSVTIEMLEKYLQETNQPVAAQQLSQYDLVEVDLRINNVYRHLEVENVDKYFFAKEAYILKYYEWERQVRNQLTEAESAWALFNMDEMVEMFNSSITPQAAVAKITARAGKKPKEN